MKPYYADDAVRLYLGDCLSILPHLGPVDHVITDPPYSEQTHTGARTARNYAFTSGDTTAPLITFQPMSYEGIREAFDAITVRRWCVAFMDWRHVAAFEADPPGSLRFIRFGVWAKPNSAPQFTGDRPAPGWEAVCIMHGAEEMRWNGGGSRAVWTHAKEPHNQHPTQKPLPLMRQIVNQFTDPGETILDPFGGSMTTALACKQLGRKCIAIEMNEDYVKVGVERLTVGTRAAAEMKRGQGLLL